MYIRKDGVEFIMTEIIVKEIKNKGLCAIDNHNHKHGKTYSILFSGTQTQINNYLTEKGIGV